MTAHRRLYKSYIVLYGVVCANKTKPDVVFTVHYDYVSELSSAGVSTNHQEAERYPLPAV